MHDYLLLMFVLSVLLGFVFASFSFPKDCPPERRVRLIEYSGSSVNTVRA